MTPSFRALSWLNAFWKQSMRFMHNHQLYWQIIYGASSPKSLGRLHSYKGYRWAHHTHTHTHTYTLTHTVTVSDLPIPNFLFVFSCDQNCVLPPKMVSFPNFVCTNGKRLLPTLTKYAHTFGNTENGEQSQSLKKKIISIRRIEPQCNSSTMQEPIHFSLHNWS